MLTRRAFLEASSLAVAGGMVPAAETSGVPDQGQARELPGAIAALTPMRAGVEPITADERRGRIERARRLMAEHGLDALMLTGGTSLVYFSNVRWGLSERLFALVLSVRGEPFVVSPAFEEDRARSVPMASRCSRGTKTRVRTASSRTGSRRAGLPPAGSGWKKRCGSCSPTAWARRRPRRPW